MFAIVGLGNPGEEYSQTRHNAGFIVIDKLANELSANYWKDECGAKVAHCENVLLIKPQSFMNLSGGPVKNILKKYKINELIVVHDDMDIKSSSIRIKRGGGNAGHNGLKSIDDKLQSNDYIRVRVGVDKPKGPSINYVLSAPKGKLEIEFQEACDKAVEAVLFLMNNSLEKAQQKFN